MTHLALARSPFSGRQNFLVALRPRRFISFPASESAIRAKINDVFGILPSLAALTRRGDHIRGSTSKSYFLVAESNR